MAKVVLFEDAETHSTAVSGLLANNGHELVANEASIQGALNVMSSLILDEVEADFLVVDGNLVDSDFAAFAEVESRRGNSRPKQTVWPSISFVEPFGEQITMAVDSTLKTRQAPHGQLLVDVAHAAMLDVTIIGFVPGDTQINGIEHMVYKPSRVEGMISGLYSDIIETIARVEASKR